MTYSYTFYGLTVSVPFHCPMLIPASPGVAPDLTVVEKPVPLNLSCPVAADHNWEAAPGRFLVKGGKRAGRFLVEGGTQISLERNPAADDSRVAALFKSAVIAALFRQRGHLVLHANVAVTPNGALAVSGESGAGKSTTLGALVGRGCTMLADDITVLDLKDDGTVMALPGMPKLNLCEDAAVALGHDPFILPRNPLRRSKVEVFARDSMTNHPVPLTALCQLRQYQGCQLRKISLTGSEKFSLLQECIYGPVFPDEHFRLFTIASAFTEQVKMFRIERPVSRWSLDEVVEALING